MKARKLMSKLKSEAGETLGEVMVALLIAALALTMLASAITSASRMITQSKTKMGSYYAAANGLNSSEEVTLNSVKIVTKTTGTITISIKDGDKSDHSYEDTVSTYSIKESVAGGVKVTAYKK